MTGRTYTHPNVLTKGVAEGWADPETDPARIDWAARQAAAAIPFEVIDGRPVNPCETTAVRYGRNELGHWGEALAADALVSVTDRDGRRWILMVERSDGHGWALPGGHVDPGETPAQAAVRELAEETGLVLPAGAVWQAGAPRYVPDPRASDEAWMVTVLCTAHLGAVEEFPEVVGADDAARAAWVRADGIYTLSGYLAETYRGEVFAAHVQMLTEALNTPTTVGKPKHSAIAAGLRSVLARIEATFDDDADKWTADKQLCLEDVESQVSALLERIEGDRS